MAEIVMELSGSEQVFINVRDESEEAQVFKAIGSSALSRVTVVRIPTNEPWCRDHGPIFIGKDHGSPGMVATCWKFAAWGGKYEPFDDDAAASEKIAMELGIPSIRIPYVLEGGMIDSNGAGAALVSRSALLDPNRNPHLDQVLAEKLLKEHLGIEIPIWLDAQVPGDDTDGHVDTYARFVSERRVVICLDESENSFASVADAIQARIPDVEILAIAPPETFEMYGDTVPASYANFYIANRVVLLPVFGMETDRAAIEQFAILFPEHRIVPINCREIIWGLGAIHCLTCPVPALPAEDFGED